MKKVLLGALFCLLLAGCNSSSSAPATQPASVSTKESTVQDTTNDSTAESTEAVTEEEITSKISIPEQKLYDKDGITITALGFDTDNFMGPKIKLLLENNSDKNITVQIRNSSVNGYMVDLQMSANVVAGKKANNSIDIYNSLLEEAGITTITDIEFSFHIFSSETWDVIADSEQIAITTSESENYTQSYDDSGDVLYDNNGIRIISKGLILDDSLFGPKFMTFIENNSDKSITIQVRDTSINGFMITPTMSSEVMPGKKALKAMTFMSSQLEENGITDIEEIETSFHIFATSDWSTIADTEPIIISFK